MAPLVRTEIPGLECRRGKVRDIFDLGQQLVIVATDRISAFDWVLPTPIPDKGRMLSQMTRFWFHRLGVPNHFISDDVNSLPPAFQPFVDQLRGRTMVVRKAEVIPVECVVRGYLAGSGWKEYHQTGAVCGLPLPPGLRQADRLPEPIFTPASKEASGHDINITHAQMTAITGHLLAEELKKRSLEIYLKAAYYAAQRGIIIADTKFEWGKLPGRSGELILIDEVLTPDSSRFWPRDAYQPGGPQPSFDKQIVRDWLETTAWDKNSPPPPLPHEVVAKTRSKYLEAFERLTGAKFQAA